MAAPTDEWNPMTRAIRILAALVILTFLGRQLRVVLASSIDVFDFLSYSTVLSNLLAALVLVSLALRPSLVDSASFTWIRGVATLSMFAIGLFFIAWVSANPLDALKHAVGPTVILLDWLKEPPRHLSLTSVLSWLIAPAAYLGYTLVRGAFTGWYPNAFLDPSSDGGYARVAGVSIVVLVGMAVVSLLLARFAFIKRRSGARVRPPGCAPSSSQDGEDEQAPNLASHNRAAVESGVSVSG